MANNRIPAFVERRPGGCSTTPGPGTRHPQSPDPAQGCTPVGLGAEVKDEQARRFQLAAWMLEGQHRLGAQRAHSGLLLVLGNVVLLALVVLLSFLALGGNPGWWPLLIATGLTLACIFISALFALLAGASLHPGGGSAALEAGLFFHSGQTLPVSEAQFSQRFLKTTRQQMLVGALGELYAQWRSRARQERLFRWAMLAFALALLLFTLTVLVLLVVLVW